jgi:hypothetical protein
MPDRKFSVAVTLAKSLLNAREQFVNALRAAAMAQIEAEPPRQIRLRNIFVPRRILESHADDAVYAIGRDGAVGIETHVRFAIDEIVRETVKATGREAIDE